MTHSLILIGAGNMGGALFSSWARWDGLDRARSAVVTPNPSDRVLALCNEYGIALNPETDGDGYDIAIVAVKPQMFPDVLPSLHWPGMDKTIFASVAAGVTIATIRSLLKVSIPAPKVVRTMPNLPSAIGKGMSLLTAEDDISTAERDAVTALFDAAGASVWCDTEDQLDRLMGVSGCGPAFVFLFAEALEEAALAEGASPEDAKAMAIWTLAGSAEHLAKDGRAAADLRAAVTSPGGTTAEGVRVLDDPDDGFRPMVKRAVRAAYARAKELGA